MSRDIRRKLVVVGDGGCGKTSLLIVFGKGEFPSVYVPTVFENYVNDIEIDGEKIELAIWDTAGQEEYDRLRPLSYPNAHIVLICYSADSKASLQNVASKWAPEVGHFCPHLPIMLIGCKIDLRETEEEPEDDGLDVVRREKVKKEWVTYEDGEKIAKEINAKKHLECSALKNQGVREVFEAATREALNVKLKPKKNCLII